MSDFAILAFHSLEFAVGNAKTMATYFVSRFGFKHVAYRGLETDSRYAADHVVSNGDITFIIRSVLIGRSVTNDYVSRINVVVKGTKPEIKPYMGSPFRIGVHSGG